MKSKLSFYDEEFFIVEFDYLDGQLVHPVWNKISKEKLIEITTIWFYETSMNTHYSADSKAHFINDMDAKLNRLEGDPDELKAIYLGIYGNAVKNKELFDN